MSNWVARGESLTRTEAELHLHLETSWGKLLALKWSMEESTARRPVAVVLPEAMDPGLYKGPGATDCEAQLMGLPVLWGKTTGLVYEA